MPSRRGFDRLRRTRPGRRLASALVVQLLLLATVAWTDGAAGSGDAAQAGRHAPGTPALRAPDRASVESSLDQVLARKGYSFCHDPNASLDQKDRALCPLADAMRARCPGFAKACKRPSVVEGCLRATRSSRSLTGGGVLAAIIGTLARALLWLVSIGIVVFIALELARAYSRRSAGPTREALDASPPDARTPVAPGETDAGRLLVRARARAADGDFRGAVDDLYRALLRQLDAGGRIHLHPSNTNGDYARQLAAAPDLARTFRELARELERVQFGKRAPTAELFAWLEARIAPIVARAAVFALLVWVAGFATGCGAHRSVGTNLQDQWCGTDAAGYGVFCALMSDTDVSVRRRVRPLDKIDDDVAVVVVTTADLSQEQWDVLRSWTEDGGTLVLAAHPTPLDQWAGAASSGAECSGTLKLSSDWAQGDLANATFEAPAAPTLVAAQGASVIARCQGAGYVVGGWPGDGSTVLLASTAFLSNASLAAGDNARLVSKLIQPGSGVVEMVGPWTGSGAPNPFAAVFRAGLGPWLLELLALLAVFAWSRGVRFGSPRPLTSSSRHAFVEHVRALGERYRKRGAARFVLSNYGAWALDRLRERLRSRGAGRLSDVAEAVARRTGDDTASVMRLLVDARSAQDETGDLASADQLATLRALAEVLEKLESSSEHRGISAKLR